MGQTTDNIPSEIHVRKLQQEEAYRNALTQIAGPAAKTWVVQATAYFTGILIAAAAYFAQGNVFVALSAGVAMAALIIAKACLDVASKNHAAIQALTKLNT